MSSKSVTMYWIPLTRAARGPPMHRRIASACRKAAEMSSCISLGCTAFACGTRACIRAYILSAAPPLPAAVVMASMSMRCSSSCNHGCRAVVHCQLCQA
eukprot:scaffold91358_cov58-Phaeocystis_antarctica.AAC.1